MKNKKKTKKSKIETEFKNLLVIFIVVLKINLNKS